MEFEASRGPGGWFPLIMEGPVQESRRRHTRAQLGLIWGLVGGVAALQLVLWASAGSLDARVISIWLIAG